MGAASCKGAHVSACILVHFDTHHKDFFEKFGLLKCKPILIPMEPNTKLCVYKGKGLGKFYNVMIICG